MSDQPTRILDPTSEFFREQVQAELFKLKVKEEARRLRDRELAESFAVQDGVLAYGEMPADPPELLEGILLAHGATAIVGEKETGKAQPLDAMVLTLQGWKPMGALQIGDKLASPDGTPSEVVAVHERGERQVFRVTFSDGRSTEVCAEHLWETYHPQWHGSRLCARCQDEILNAGESTPRVLTTQQVAEIALTRRKNVYIPLVSKFEEPLASETPLPLHPWLMGVLLGDGSFVGHIDITSADPELISKAQSLLPKGVEIVKKKSKYTYSIRTVGGTHKKGVSGVCKNLVQEVLKDFGLWGHRSWEKFIPDCYITTTKRNKEMLLAGLLDTDGYVSKKGSVSLCTTSEKMAQQVVDLVRSIGGLCSIKKVNKHFTYKGEKKQGRPAYQLSINYSNLNNLVSLRRKVNRISPKEIKRLTFRSIEPSRITQTRCITVSHPRGLYITDDYIVTHNSLTALEIQSSLLTGSPLWGEIKPSKTLTKTVHFLAEHTSVTLQGLYHRTKLPHAGDLRIFGPEHLGPHKLLVSSGVRREAAVSYYKKLAEGAGLVVFDPLASFIQGQAAENDNSPMRNLVDTMIEIAQSTGAACLVLAHQGKPTYFNGQKMKKTAYATRGASSSEDAFTAVHYLEKIDGVRFGGNDMMQLRPVHFKGRKAQPFRLVRDLDTCRQTLLARSIELAG